MLFETEMNIYKSKVTKTIYR